MPSPRFVVPVTDLVRALAADRRFGPHIEAVNQSPPVEARFGDWPAGLAPELRNAAVGLGIARLFSHQAAAVSVALGGDHVAVASGTASGKSLCYVLPVLQEALRAPDARSLWLFPTKALAHDQLAALAAWDRALPELDLKPAAYDGDTAQGVRGEVRRAARVVVTNPDMLHAGVLPHHTRWAALFEGLTHIVVDEMHVYRGVFGSHVANVLRRLRRVARFYGAAPRFILTSATIANPGELATALTGGPVTVVDDDGSPRGHRWFVLYNPPVVDERLNLRRSSLLETDAVARHFLAGGVQTIVFARSRQATELIVRYINDGLDAPPGAARTSATPVRGYRGGYTTHERREIEALLRNGKLRGVVATNALELGIDIGQLDACVMSGYPGTVASTRQQSGRAGRRAADAAAVLVASATPLDQFIVRHPEYLLGRSPEHARINPDNLLILLDHLRCAAFELSFGPDEAARPFGAPDVGDDDPAAQAAPPVASLLAVLEAQGVVRQVAGTWYWLADAYPAEGVGLRSSGPAAVTIVVNRGGDAGGGGGARAGVARTDRGETDRDRPGSRPARGGPAGGGAAGGGRSDEGQLDGIGAASSSGGDEDGPGRFDVLGTVERSAAAQFVHPGAIYLHDGQTYQVTALDWDGGRAVVAPVEPVLYTRVDGTRVAGRAALAHGELAVTARVTGYRKLRLKTHETVGWGDVDLPEQTHTAGGYWFTLDDEAVTELQALGRWQAEPPGDRGPDWPAQRDRARARDGLRCRLCEAPERPGRAHDVHHIRPFRDFGWARGANEAFREANDLANLITLCPACHRRAERALGLQGGLGGVASAFRAIAPLYLMCDARDIDVSAESLAPWTGRPTVAVYERASAGVGFGPALFDLHEPLVTACIAMIEGCPCATGCPSCVGPADESGPDAKAHALAVLHVLST